MTFHRTSEYLLAFSVFVFVEGRRRYKRDVFLKIHELMIGEGQDDVIEMWGDPAYRAWRAAQPFVVRRARRSGLPAYPYFRYLAERAESLHGEAYTKSSDA